VTWNKGGSRPFSKEVMEMPKFWLARPPAFSVAALGLSKRGLRSGNTDWAAVLPGFGR
jgi:hypothetical protein